MACADKMEKTADGKKKELPPGVTDKAAWMRAEEIVRKQHGTTDGKWGLVRHIYDQMTGHARRDKATAKGGGVPPLYPGEKPLVVDGVMLEYDTRVHGEQPTAKGFVALAREVMAKAGGPPGDRWNAIPGGKHGGYRKLSGGKFIYWYPDAASAKAAHEHHAEQAKKARKREAKHKANMASHVPVKERDRAATAYHRAGMTAEQHEQHAAAAKVYSEGAKERPKGDAKPSGFLGQVMSAADEHNGNRSQVVAALTARHGSGYVMSKEGLRDIDMALAHWRSFAENRGKERAAKSFQLLAADAMAKAGAYVGTPQQGVPFTGPLSPLVPSSLAADERDKYKGERYSYGEGMGKAEWTAAYVNDLPDSAFLHIAAGGKKDQSGRTVPRSLRKFPVRGMDGKFDAPHIRNAIGRAPQATDMSADDKARVQRKARDILKRMGGSEE